jgi:hypothetical protein
MSITVRQSEKPCFSYFHDEVITFKKVSIMFFGPEFGFMKILIFAFIAPALILSWI